MDSTKFTPPKLNFGRELKPPKSLSGICFEDEIEKRPPSTAEVHKERGERFKQVYERCHQNLRMKGVRRLITADQSEIDTLSEKGHVSMEDFQYIDPNITLNILTQDVRGQTGISSKEAANTFRVEECEAVKDVILDELLRAAEL
ncbi:hypothetical protein J6590_036242 [Homalodisca vitripennis]|nr:hypothetical protein J6590_036242 [Homalodisca vitripennis]